MRDTPAAVLTEAAAYRIVRHIVEALGLADAVGEIAIHLVASVTLDGEAVLGLVTREDVGRYTVYVDQGGDLADVVETLAHELRHVYQFHVGWIDPDAPYTWMGQPYPRNRHYAKRPEERDAERWAGDYWGRNREMLLAMAAETDQEGAT